VRELAIFRVSLAEINVLLRIVAFLLLLVAGEISAQAVYESQGGGNWTAAGSWTLISGPDGDADGIPDANDNVTIRDTHSIQINNNTNSACNNLTLQGTAEIDFTQNNRTLTVNGTMTMNGNSRVQGAANRTLILLGPFIVPTGQIGTIHTISVSQSASQDFTVLGELVSSSGTGTKTIGNVLINSGGTSTGKWTFTGAETWDVQNFTIYDGPVGQALVDGAATGTFNIAGNFSVVGTTGGQKSKLGRLNMTVTGTTNIAGWLLFYNVNTGNKRFNNTVTVNSTGTWDNEVGEDPFINGSIVNNGSWPVSTGGVAYYTVETAGSYTYTGSGTINMSRLIVNAGTVTNQATLNLVGDAAQGLQVNNAAFINGDGGYITFPCTNPVLAVNGTGTVDFSGSSNTVEYTLTGNQNIFLTPYYKLACSGSGTKTAPTGTTTVSSELNLSGAAILNMGANTLSGSGNLVMTGTSELRLSKTGVNHPELTGASNSLAAGTTITLNGTAAQTLKSSATFPYQNVTISGGGGSAVSFANVSNVGNVTLTSQGAITAIPAGGLTVAGTYNSNSGGTTTMTAGNLTVGNIVLDGAGTLNYTGRTITINGNNGTWTKNSNLSLVTNSSSAVVFTTGTNQQLGGTNATTFQNLTIDNSNGVTLNTVNPTVSGTLNLIAGALITGANKVIAPTVTRTSGFVQGNLQKPVALGTNVTITYDVGSGTTYAPVTLVFASVSGTSNNFVVSTTAGDHPQILSANIETTSTVNRYYTLMRVGNVTFTTVSATLNFGSGDVDGGFSPLVDASIKGYDGAWTSAPVGTRTTTSTEFVNIPVANFPNNTPIDFQIGKRIIVTGFFNRLTGGPLDWHAASTWINNQDGNITVTNGSPNVTGSGTLFLLQLTAGDQIVLQATPSLAPVTIQSITNNTALVLTAPYPHANATGSYGRLAVPNSSADSVVIGNPVFNGGAGGADVATTIELTANAQVHTLAVNEPPNGRTTAQTLTHIGTSQLTALNVSVNQPTSTTSTTDSWNINAGSAVVTGNLTIGSANNNINRIARVVMTSGTLSVQGDLIFRTNGAGNEGTALLDVGSGRVNLTGTLQSIGNRASLTMGTTGVFNFNSTTAAQSLDLPDNSPATFIYSNIECNNTSANGVQLAKTLTSTNITGNFRVLTGKFQMPATGNFNLAGGGTKIFEVANGATLEMLGNASQTFPTGFGTITLGNTSTVVYGQTAAITLPTSPASYGNLTFSGNPNYSFPNSTITVNGDLTIGNGSNNPNVFGTTATTLNVTGNLTVATSASINATNIGTLTLHGNWTNNGTFTAGAGTTSVVFGGNGATQPQTIGGTSSDTFYNLGLNTNDVTDIVQMSKDISVSNALTLTKGGLDINSNLLSVTNAAAAAIVRTAPGDVGYIKSETTGSPYSRLRRTIDAATGVFVYPFGKSSAAADYIPFICEVTAAGGPTGTFEISTYPTATNNTPFPSGVTNVNSGGDATGSQVVDRFWILTRAGFTTVPTANITFTATSGEAAGIAGNLRAQRWTPGNIWETALPGQNNPTSYSVTVPGVTTFSPWTLASHLSPLPIELLKFDGRPAGGVVDLSWETAIEINNQSFEVERSQDGEEFIPIGSIPGARNSRSVNKYNFTDTYPLAGNAYYRLRQTDHDGRSTYSWVIRVETPATFTIVAWPNPWDGRVLNISWRDGEPGALVSVRLRTYAGAKAFEGSLYLDAYRSSTISFDTQLSPGIYILETQTASGVHQMKVVVR